MKSKQYGQTIKKKNSTNSSELKRLIVNRLFAIFLLIILVLAISFGIYKVAIFVQNPTETFIIEEGSISQEERSIRTDILLEMKLL